MIPLFDISIKSALNCVFLRFDNLIALKLSKNWQKMEFSLKKVSSFADLGVQTNSRAYTLIRDPRIVLSKLSLHTVSI